MSERKSGRVITFYSYKGGVGRTQALADVAVMLAQLGKQVLAIDWDLEAPGLHLYFDPIVKGKAKRRGLIDLLIDFDDGLPPETILEETRVLTIEGTGQRLHFLRAGGGQKHARLVQQLDWDKLYSHGFGQWLERARSLLQEKFDFILIDSRTGISDAGGVCTIQLPEILVILFTPNRQSLDGVSLVAQTAVEGQAQLPVDRAPLSVVPIATRIDNTERKLRLRWEREIEAAFSPLVEPWTDAPKRTGQLLNELAVPYVPYWSYGEELPSLSKDRSDRLSVEYAHETLALLLAQELTEIESLLDNRNAVRESFSKPRNQALDRGRPLRIFLSYRRADSQWAAMAIYRALQSVLPPDHVFMDVESIPVGVDFVEYLDGWIRKCDLLLAVIGPGWLQAQDPSTGKRRLDNEYDFVRIEIRQAFERELAVVPVLVNGARFPSSAELPDDLKQLARLNGAVIDFSTANADIERLVTDLQLKSAP